VLDLSPEKILILGLLALIVLGPNRLPQAARSLGHILGHLRHMSSSFQDEVRDALSEPAQALGAAASEFRPVNPLDVRRSITDAVTNALTVPPAPGATPTNGTAAPTMPPAGQTPVAPTPATQTPAFWAGSTPPAFPPAAPDDPSLN
jgi:sec-independent protein translocase protein TatB